MSNGVPAPSSQGSDSFSSASSLSSGTPVSSLSGLSQVLFPPPFGSDMVDVAISTEDRPRTPRTPRTAESSMQTDPQAPPPHSRPPSPYGSQPGGGWVATETSRTVGATVLLRDTLVHEMCHAATWISVSLRRSRWEKKEAVFTVLEKETQ